MPFQLINSRHHEEINRLVEKIPTTENSETASHLAALIEQIRTEIPEKRRISTGRYSIVKALGELLHPLLEEPFGFGGDLFENPGDPFVRSLALQILSLDAMDEEKLEMTKPYFESAARDEDWIIRECASGLVRKLIKAFPESAKGWYLDLALSEDPFQRRFVSESLRPVVENRWFHKQPEYALDIIKNLFKESAPYPRTSVGNNLSDWMRVNEEIAWPIVEKLASSGDRNSYWIAYRACRNLVKKKPLRVMDLLGVDEYKYKNRLHRREEIG